MTRITVFDDFLTNPEAYRDAALQSEFRTMVFPEATFHGISIPVPPTVPEKLMRLIPSLRPTLSFFRRSPAFQEEPHFIHTDIDMGEWSSVLYLNPDRPDGDGTSFWTHNGSGEIESTIPHQRSEEGRTSDGWTLRETVLSKFNRLVLFPSSYFHSRAIFENWGKGYSARLTQVTFGVFQ